MHKLAGNKWRRAALAFCHVQTVIFFVCHTEGFILAYPTKTQITAYPAIMAILCGLSTMAYDQILLLVTYIALALYQILRHHFYYLKSFQQAISVISSNSTIAAANEDSSQVNS